MFVVILPLELAVYAFIVPLLIAVGCVAKLTLDRLANIGYPKWYVVFYLVPAYNAWLVVMLGVAPEGYADHKTFDLTGQILLGVFFVLVFIVGLIVALSGG